MDLVKARERAKEKARENGEKPKEKERRQTGADETAAPVEPKKEARKKTSAKTPPLPKSGGRGKEVTLQKSAPPPAAREKAEKGAAAAEQRSVQSPSAKDERPLSPAAAEPVDIFEDTAFGEDLPAGFSAEGPEQGMFLGELPEEKPDSAPSRRAENFQVEMGTEEESFEVRGGEKTGGPEKRAEPRPAAESVPLPRPGAVASPSAPAEAAKSKSRPKDQPAVSPPSAPPTSVPRRSMEWDSFDEGWTVGKEEEKKEEDFFALVSEELYMREFGKAAEEEGEQLELLSFRLAQEIYAVPLTSIKQIIKLIPITVVPRAPAHILGIISLRGTIIPVFDLRKVLHLPMAQATRRSRIVIVAEGKYIGGMIVDEVEQVVRLPRSRIEPPPPVLAGVEAEYLEGIGRIENKMIILLSLVKVLVPVNP